MRLGRALRLSVPALLAHRLRTTLAIISVAVGVTGVLLSGALGRGAAAEVQRGIDAAGSNLLVVRPVQVKRSAARKAVRGVVTTLRLDDYRAMAILPAAARAAPGVEGALRVRIGGGAMPASILGTTPALATLRNLRLKRGRFLDDEDDARSLRVAVLGSRIGETLFGEEDPVGRDIRLGRLPFEVIGVLEAKGIQADGSDQDGSVFIPVRTALRRVLNTTWLSAVFVSVQDRAQLTEAATVMTELLRERHRLPAGAPDDFQVQDQSRLLALKGRAVESITVLTETLAGVATLVGGVGIAALMFLSVKERTAEIGLRMAVGARPRDVLLQFLGEATLLSVGGWLLGSTVAVVGGLGVAFGTEWKVAFPLGTTLASFLMALLTGLGAGALPARKAAQKPPIQALGAGS
jgi:putative ABC transport system permease protein